MEPRHKLSSQAYRVTQSTRELYYIGRILHKRTTDRWWHGTAEHRTAQKPTTLKGLLPSTCSLADERRHMHTTCELANSTVRTHYALLYRSAPLSTDCLTTVRHCLIPPLRLRSRRLPYIKKRPPAAAVFITDIGGLSAERAVIPRCQLATGVIYNGTELTPCRPPNGSSTLHMPVTYQTRCSAIAERPRCTVCYSFRQK